MNKKLKIVLAILIVILIVAFGIWKWVNKPFEDIKNATGIKISAMGLYNSFLNDSATAKATYTNQVVEVSGQIIQVNTNQQNQQVILLKTNTTDAAINCTMEEKATGIKPGDTIIIKGKCGGYISGDTEIGIPGDVLLIRCYQLK